MRGLVLGSAAFIGALVGQLILSAMWPASVVLFDLPLLVVLYYALDRGPAAALLLGAGAGIVQDSLAGSLLGAGAVSRGVVGFIVGSAGLRFLLSGALPQVLVISCGTLAARLLELLTLAVMGRQLVLPPIQDLLAGVAGNSLVGWTAFALLRRDTTS